MATARSWQRPRIVELFGHTAKAFTSEKVSYATTVHPDDLERVAQKGGSERVLFVDDEESLVNLNHQRLERLGYRVKSTTDPEEALEWFRADPDRFDIIITDMTMPPLPEMIVQYANAP